MISLKLIEHPEKDSLKELFQHEAFPALMEFIDKEIEGQIRRLLSYNLNGKEENDKKVLNAKLKVDGMQDLRQRILGLRNLAIKGEK